MEPDKIGQERMRVLMAAPVGAGREGGVANVLYNQAQGLRALGHEVTCWFREDILGKDGRAGRLEMLRLATELARRIREAEDSFDVALIHAPAGLVYGMLQRLRRQGTRPAYVMMLHGIEERRIHAMSREARKGRAWYFRFRNRVWQHLYLMPLYRLSIVTCDHAVVINRETWSMLQLKYGRDAERVWYIPNGVEERFLRPRSYGTGEATKLLFVGTWLDHKGVYYLKDGFEMLAEDYPELRLTIAGCMADAKSVLSFFSPEIRARVDVIPFVAAADMPSLYEGHDIFVFPSLMEGMPIVLLEAMASGLPVVTTETCGMMDVVEDRYNGLLAKPADAKGFAAQVRKLIEFAELREGLGRRAQETMRRSTWDAMAVSLEQALRAAVEVKAGTDAK
jgi:glycosyltransferase involved in cell wall biosynthesis